ncbi:MAG: hypothetical protein AAB492_01135 [Patescibacteria group bacterium]
MNKDALLATIIGFGVGLILTGLVFLGPSLFKSFPSFSLPKISWPKFFTSQSSATPTPTPIKTSGTLMIEAPLPDSIELRSETLVSGKTKPRAIVVVETTDTETVVVANDLGAFATKITLSEGKNELVVSSHEGKEVQTQTLTVFYSSVAL